MYTLDKQKEIYQNKVNKGFNLTNIETEFLNLIGETHEAYVEYCKKDKEALGEELADIGIYLLGISEMLDINLGEEIEKKVFKNSKRTYKSVGENVYIKTEGVEQGFYYEIFDTENSTILNVFLYKDSSSKDFDFLNKKGWIDCFNTGKIVMFQKEFIREEHLLNEYISYFEKNKNEILRKSVVNTPIMLLRETQNQFDFFSKIYNAIKESKNMEFNEEIDSLIIEGVDYYGVEVMLDAKRYDNFKEYKQTDLFENMLYGEARKFLYPNNKLKEILNGEVFFEDEYLKISCDTEDVDSIYSLYEFIKELVVLEENNKLVVEYI